MIAFQLKFPRRWQTAVAALALASVGACTDAPPTATDDPRAGDPYIRGVVSLASIDQAGGGSLLVEAPEFAANCGFDGARVDVVNRTSIRWETGASATLGDLEVGQHVSVWIVASVRTSCPVQVSAGAITIAGAPRAAGG